MFNDGGGSHDDNCAGFVCSAVVPCFMTVQSSFVLSVSGIRDHDTHSTSAPKAFKHCVEEDHAA